MISIHTSAREVTKVQEVIFDYLKISIHTSAREVTGSSSKPYQGCNHFNPHFRKGSDDIQRQKRGFQAAFQSTLPQGKWLTPSAPSKPVEKFQSTLPQGKWPNNLMYGDTETVFQSTLPQGKWRKRRWQWWWDKKISIHTSAREVTRRSFGSSFFVRRFQSTLPQGKWRCDRILWQSRICISIHTSAREVTRLAVRDIATMTISIHTSAREVTALRKMYGSNCVWFQSTLPQGKWQYGKSKNRRALWFQSTLPQGKWLYNITDRTKMELFQSTLPQGKWRGEMDYSQFRAYFNPHFRKGSD